jgi:DeoR family fructose operon transcriptional repressor
VGRLAAERRLELVAWGREVGKIDALNAAHRFGVAVETIRRDLELLQRQGIVRRVHGGGILIDRIQSELSVEVRRSQNHEVKKRIVEVAATYIPKSGTVIVDAGTTTELLAPFLRNRSGLTVVTNSLILSLAIGETDTNVVLLGGRIRPVTLSAVGTHALNMVSSLHASVCFIGTNGIDARVGLTTPDIDEAEVKRVMIENSQESIVLTDHSKFSQIFTSSFASASQIDRIVTDIAAPIDQVDAFRNAEVEVVLA